MEKKEKKSIYSYMRSLHRDIGFLVIGLTIIYGLSGIVLIYRDTNFLKREKQVVQTLAPNSKDSELGMALHIRNLQVTKIEGNIVYFENGTYDRLTGEAKYVEKALPSFLDNLNNLHKTSSNGIVHWVATIYAALLIFLAISSLLIFKPGTKLFGRGMLLTSIGIIAAIVLLLI